MSSFAATSWQNHLYRKISNDLRLTEYEEIEILKLKTDALRGLRKRLVSRRFD